jgi:hypothetical protein
MVNLFLKNLYEFQSTPVKVTVRRLRNLTLNNKNIPFKIWGETLEGDSYSGREVFTFIGPSRSPGVGYNYNARGYMIMYDMSKGEPRTFVYDLITKLQIGEQVYEVN